MFNSIDGMRISMPSDEEGMVGRECPVLDCEGYFKIKLGTGIIEDGYDKCFCPYCGHGSTQDHFFTKEQIKYAESIAIQEVQKALGNEIKKWDRQLKRSTRNSFIKLRMDYKQSHHPIAHYAEKELESILVCENCSLEYAVYGKFAYCPDCGVDNTLQILRTNIQLVEKLLRTAQTEEDEAFKEHLIQNSLEDVISVFDSFGRNSLRLFTKSTEKEKLSLSFQNIAKAKEVILHDFDFDFSKNLKQEDWKKVVVNFQKRHLISHNDGIVDETYMKKTDDESAVVGRKVELSGGQVSDMLLSIEVIAKSLQSGLANWKSQIERKDDNA